MRMTGRYGRTTGSTTATTAGGVVCLAVFLATLLTTATAAGDANDSRLKDLARLDGLARQPVLGYGLVVGLSGTGDGQSSEFMINSMAAMLERLGVTVDPSTLKPKNVAAVMVTAHLDPQTAVGSLVDVTVSSVGDASSLEGGMLVMTPLMAPSGVVSMLAQGPISIGGFNIGGGSGNSFRKNHATVGLIPGGGRVERQGDGRFVVDDRLTWLLHHPDFSTATNVAETINHSFGTGTARALDAQRVQVTVPAQFRDAPVPFVAQMGDLRASVDAPARVVINERTGTIIVGKGVRLREAAVAHGTLKVVIETRYDVSQPSSFSSAGRTVVTPQVATDVDEKDASVLRVPDTGTVADVVGVLNEIGAAPRDIIAILQALKTAGSLQAELQIM